MPLNRTEEITCPRCKGKGQVTVWDSINVDLNPELRESVFNYKLWEWICPHCGVKVFVPWKTLYHDMAHKFVIFLDFNKPYDYDYVPLDNDELKAFSKLNYTMRHVFGIEELKEKILILESGLKDIAVERMKYEMSQTSGVAECGFRMTFGGIEEPDKDHKYGSILFIVDSEKYSMKVYTGMEQYFEYCRACVTDLRMRVKGCVCIDEEWIRSRLAEG